MLTFRTEAPAFNQMLDRIESIDGADIQLKVPTYADFGAPEFARRYARLRMLMELDQIDAVLLTQEENVRYFTGYLSVLWTSKFRPFVALLPKDIGLESAVVVSHQELGNVKETSWVPRPIGFPPQDPPMPFVARAVEERGLAHGRIGLELGFGQRLGMNQQQLNELVTLLPQVEFVDATPFTQAVRMLKSQSEIERLERASAITEAGVRAGWEELREGQTERDIVRIMAARMYELGAEFGTKPSFVGILAGDRWRLANAVASDYRVKKGDLVLVDGGATFRGYVCDFIRQASLGPLTRAQVDWFDRVIEATRVAVGAIRPGVAAHRVYEAALEYLADRGLAQGNRMNIIGHGIGMDIHELPWLGEAGRVYSSDTTLREGMVLSIEPGVVRWSEDGPPGHFIVEDVVAVTPSGARVLTDQLSNEVWCTGSSVTESMSEAAR
jgi:Xaa-Pro aminopeptidase